MPKKILYFLSFAVWLISGFSVCRSSENDLVTEWRDYPQAFALRNASVELVIAPSVGRIICYRFHGGKNLLWLKDVPTAEGRRNMEKVWNNYGGARVWISPEGVKQKAIIGRLWPPDTTTDGKEWSVLRRDESSVVLQSGVSPHSGLRVTRTVTLTDNESTVLIHTLMERINECPHPAHIWDICQIAVPEYGLLDRIDSAPFPVQTFYGKWSQEKHLLQSSHAARFDWPERGESKVGTCGNWTAAVYKDSIFVNYGLFAKDASYNDKANCEIFVNADLPVLELELLSPCVALKKGEALQSAVVWKLLKTEKTLPEKEAELLIRKNFSPVVPVIIASLQKKLNLVSLRNKSKIKHSEFVTAEFQRWR